PLLASGDERRFEVPLRADLEENHLLSGYAHRVFDVFRLKFVSGIAWIDEQRDLRGAGQQLFQELQPLRQQLRSVQSHAGGVAARPANAGHEAIADWIRADKRIGMVVVASFAALADTVPPAATIRDTRRCTSSAASSGSRAN